MENQINQQYHCCQYARKSLRSKPSLLLMTSISNSQKHGQNPTISITWNRNLIGIPTLWNPSHGKHYQFHWIEFGMTSSPSRFAMTFYQQQHYWKSNSTNIMTRAVSVEQRKLLSIWLGALTKANTNGESTSTKPGIIHTISKSNPKLSLDGGKYLQANYQNNGRIYNNKAAAEHQYQIMRSQSQKYGQHPYWRYL